MTPLDSLLDRAWIIAAAFLGLGLTWYTASPWIAVASGTIVLLLGLAGQANRAKVEAAGTIQSDPATRLSGHDLAAALPDPVIFFNADGLVVDANQAANTSFGKMEPGLGLLLKFRAPDIRTLIEDLLSGTTPMPVDYAERFPLERAFRVFGSRVGNDGLFVLVFRDQTEVRRIDRMRADFIANASHELRTPLASVSGFIETLRGPARDDAKARDQFLDIMQNQAGRMARLLDDLLSLSRLEMKPRLDGGSKVDLKEIVRSVLDTLTPMASESGIALNTALLEGEAFVTGDRDELFQVVQNLVENACKYGRSGGRVVVSISANATGNTELSVTDFGQGIAAEHIPRITERFYRVEQQKGRAEKGTGLGLAIVKHILARHEARLNVHSEPGVQTIFSVEFPTNIKTGK